MRAEGVERLAHEVLPDLAHLAVLLQRLARDVERQVAGVDHAAQEAQPRRQQLLAVRHDEHAPHVELDARAVARGVEEVLRPLARYVEQRGELCRALGLGVDRVSSGSCQSWERCR
jgi:hypothetical protein